MTKVSPWGSLNEDYPNFIAVSRYARWIEDEGRRETWAETVNRYATFMSNKLGDKIDDKTVVELHNAILDQEIMPSMRALMTAGEALERENIAGYNPVSGDTVVLTSDGMKEIRSLSGKSATVLNKDGRWADAEFRGYGDQDVFNVVLRRKKSGTTQTVVATGNHRWVKTNGDVVSTAELVSGDKIPYSVAPRPDTDNIDYQLGVIHGLVYGDGTSTYSQERLKGYHIRLCGSSRELVGVFADHGKICYPPSANGDPVVMLYGGFAKTHSLKELPVGETPEYNLGFLRGWMAADGSVAKSNSQVTLCVNSDGLEWFDTYAPTVGILRTGMQRLPDKTNFGERKRTAYSLRLDRASMIADDFIIGCKRDRFIPLDYEVDYAVVSVSPAGKSDVYCAEVPDTNTFVLSNGIVTGNCAFVAVDNVRAFDEALYVLMNGTGLGFNVESAYVSKLPSMPPEFFDTETTIVVHDSKLGWAKAYKELIALLLQGQVPTWDLSRVRPAGAKLKTFGGRACLTGDTIVYKDRKKARGHNEITIADLYDLQNGEGKWKNKPNHFKQVKLRALSEKDGIFYRNNVLEVIDNGFAPVYEIVTENGYRIKATGNHRFMTSTGDYDFVDNFNVGDLIAVNGSKEKKTGVCIDCNTSVSRRSIRCRPCANQNQIGDTALLTTARQRKECRDYLGSACERCGVSETRLTVHHQDKNPYNNDWSNLETLCEPCHQVHHANERSFGDPYSHKYLSFDEIISIEYAGVERVFDLAMEAPDHNFVANGFVSHNSGPDPLDKLFVFTVESFKRASGRKLKPIEVHDIMCKIAEVVVIGGVRRSALISMSDLDDFDMSQAKSGKWWEHNGQRALSNNSAVYYDKPSVGQFFTEWSNLYESKSGERGIINMGGIRKHVASFERRDASKIVGKNPCVTADTWVATSIGARQVKDLIGAEFDIIVDSKPYSVLSDGFVYTGNKEVYLVTSTDGYSFKATADHKILTERGWVEVQDLNDDDRMILSNNKDVHVGEYDPAGYAIGSLIGDGTFSDTTAYVAVWSEDGSGAVKDELANYLSGLPHSGSYRGFFDTSNQQRAGHKSFTDVAAGYGVVRGNKTITDKIERASLEFQSGVLRGYFDADGHVEGLSTGGGVSIRLSSVSMNNMVRVQRMLQRFGIKSAIRDLYPDGRESFGGYKSKRSYRLIITGSDTARFMDVIGFSNTAKHNKYHASIGKFYNKPHVTGVGSVEYVGFEDVYDVTVDKVHRFDANGVVVHNCSEINLRSGQYCNLTEVVIDPTDTLDAIRHKVKMATILGTYQATLTDFKYVRPVWKKNTEEERLLGVSLTGIYGHKFMSGQETRKDITLPEFLRELYDLTVQVNTEWSEKFGIPASTALTTVKPSGTVSQLVGASSGIHPWYAPYYIRTVRGDNKDPLTQFLKAQGVPNEPDVTKPDDTTVFSFPVKAPSGVITSRDLSAIDHLKLYCVYRENWTDHDVSVTINVREEEWPSVGAWVYDNFDRVGGVSFLPFSDHTYKQAPYQAISEDEYNVALSNMPTRIDWVDLPLYELEDSTAGNQTLACSGSSCEIVDITK